METIDKIKKQITDQIKEMKKMEKKKKGDKGNFINLLKK